MAAADEDQLWLPAKQAASALGVTLPTLYAYVSRKMIRSREQLGTRKRQYWRADVERLQGIQDSQLQSNVALGLISETQITLITAKGLYYRGKDVVGMAETETFESVAALLWESEADAIFADALPAVPPAYARLKQSLTDAALPEKVLALLPIIERENPRLYDLSKSGFARAGADLTRWFAAILTDQDGPSAQPMHEFVVSSLRAPKVYADLVRRLLILSADHEFDPTTFAVRTVANAGVTPCYAVMTGIIVTSGQRLQSGRAGAAARLLEEVLATSNPRDSIVARFRNGEPLPEFSLPATSWDPRANALMAALQNSLGDDRDFRRLQIAAETAYEISGQRPDFILPASFVGRQLGLKGQELGIAGLGRMAGWIAHAMEQYHNHGLVRPRANYVGPLPI